MLSTEDLTDCCLVVASSGERYQTVLEVAVQRASAVDGRDLRPVRVDPLRLEAELSDEFLDLLLFGAGAVVDLSDVGPRLFRVLAWQARAHPRAVVLMRHGRAAFPLDLHAFAVRSYDTATPEGAAAARREVSRLATLAAAAQYALGSDGGHGAGPYSRRRRLRRWWRSGIVEALRQAARRLHVGDATGAAEAIEAARAEAPDAPDLALRAAVLHREAGLWNRVGAEVDAVLEADATCAAAWRELGIARDRQGDVGAADALRRAVDLGEDYEALVTLAFLESRRGAREEALPLLDRALAASEGQLNLVLPAAVLRAAHHGRVTLGPADRARVEDVLAIRGEQASDDPPEDGPWSHFDAAQACLLLGRGDEAVRFAAGAKPFLHAPWETETFARAVDALEGAGVDVAGVRAALGIAPRRAAQAPRPRPVPSGPPFPAKARDAEGFRENVPCAAACPVGTDAGAYVTLVARGEDAEAYRVARGPNPFASVCGRVCAAPCEDACRRGKVDEPVAIRAIKRYLTEKHGPESDDNRIASVLDGSVPQAMEGDAYISHLRKLGEGTVSGRRIAVVGGGPAGLACAHDLAFLGHEVTVFEATERLGGMMRLGIPEYRLPRDVLDHEIDAILSLGVEVRTNAGLGSNRTLESLFAEGFESVFLASGAGRGRDLEVDGGDLDGVVRAIDFLINVNAGFNMDIGTRVVVVGGGNVAMDVARTARLGRPPDVRAPTGPARALPGVGVLRSAVAGGAKEVHVVARQPMGEWPAQRSVHGREEVEEAKREGLVFHPLRGVRRVVGKDGRVVAVELAEVVSLRDERGRYAPVYGAHAAETIPCDTVFLAVGQEPDLDYLAGTRTLERTRDGLIATDEETLATSMPGVYAGGDAAFGPRTLIEAVAEGKRAARNIHARLSGGRRLGFQATFVEVHPRAAAPTDDYDRIPRVEPACVSVERRTGIGEVEGSYDEEEARRQASRCLACHVQTVYDGDLCIACGRCTDVCPYRCLSLVPAPLVGVTDLPGLAAAGEDTVMVKDETSCIRCGLCAERCPTGAMTMERFDWKVGATLT